MKQRFRIRRLSPSSWIGATALILTVASTGVSLSHSKFSKQTSLPSFTEKLPDSLVKFDLLQIPAGNIDMPDPTNPGKTKNVKVNKLWISKTEVGWDLFDIYAFRLDLTDDQKAKNVDVENRPSKPYGAPDRGFGHEGFAALSMHSNSAAKFCEWLSKRTGHKYRLANEAEWEYACRAGHTGAYTKEQLEEVAWFWENADDATHKIATKKPNAWGFYDMLGNCGEWAIGLDGTPVVCGGSFIEKTENCQPGFRQKLIPKWQQDDAHTPKSKWWLSNATHVGLRVVCEDIGPTGKG